MADDKTKRGGNDRAEVSDGEDYEVEYFARENSISKAQAEELIRRIGNDRTKLDEAAAKLKNEG